MKRNNSHIFLIFIAMFLVFSILLVNTFYISLFKIHYNSKTDIEKYSKNVGLYTDVLVAKRGTIYDSKKNVLAEDITTYKIIANLDKNRFKINGEPAHVVDPLTTARELAKILNGNETTFYTQLSKENVIQVELGVAGKNISWQKKEAIDQLNLPGISFVKTVSRRYPEGNFASYMIGFARYQEASDNIVGEMGIESIYNDILTGTNGYRRYQASKGSNIMIPGSQVELVEDIYGSDIYLTLNKDLQLLLEETLDKIITDKKASQAWAGLMELKTGRILAMSSRPGFNPESPNIQNYINLNTRYLFEPGSTFKVFTYAAAIDQGVYPSTTFDSRAFYFDVKNGVPVRTTSKTIHGDVRNALGLSWGNLSFDDGFIFSSNVAIAELLTNYLKPAVFKKYIEDFGFLKKVDFDGYSEEKGNIQFNYPIEQFNVGFGQGISVTTIQMLQAYSAFFNNGQMIKPYIIEQIKNPKTNEISYLAETEIIGQPISRATADKMKELMKQVVATSYGTGRFYRQADFDVMAKTGTAQIFIDGTYNNKTNLASAALAFPNDDPKFLLFYGFEALFEGSMHSNSKAINDFIYQIAMEYGLIDTGIILPERPETDLEIISSKMPNLINQTVDFALKQLKDSQVEIILLGDGKQILEQYPHHNLDIYTNQKIFLKTDQSEIVMPNMLGWSRKDVTAFWSLSQLPVTMEGYGWVISQNIPPGTILLKDSEIIVKFQ